MTRSSSKLSSGGGGGEDSASSPRATRTTRRAPSSSSSLASSPSISSIATATIKMESTASSLPLQVVGKGNNDDPDAEATTTHSNNNNNNNSTAGTAPSFSSSGFKNSESTIDSCTNSGVIATELPEVQVKVEAAEQTPPAAAAEAESIAAVNTNIKGEDVAMENEGESDLEQHSLEKDNNNEGGTMVGSAAISSVNDTTMDVDLPSPVFNDDRSVVDNSVAMSSHDGENLPTIIGEKCDESNMAEEANILTDASSLTAAAPASNGTTASEPMHEEVASAKNNESDLATYNDKNIYYTENHNSSIPSFSMTLAIGPADTQRVFHASKAFNVEVQKLQNINNNASIATSTGGADIATERIEPTKRRSMDSDKKKPAIVHSPPSRTENVLIKSSSPSSSTSEAAEDVAATSTTTPIFEEAQVSPQAQKRASQPPQQSQSQAQSFINLLLPAAKNTNDSLILSILSQLELHNKSTPEQQVSLLFFLDADKSTKLLAAFGVLSNHGGCDDDDDDDDDNDKKEHATSSKRCSHSHPPEEREDTSSSKLVARKGIIQLFQSFLTSISTCVHGGGDGGSSGSRSEGEKKDSGGASFQEDKIPGSRAPTPTIQNTSSSTLSVINQDNDVTANTVDSVSHGDWKGSDRTQREILEVATFAADNLIEYARKVIGNECNESVVEGGNRGEIEGVSFDMFGKWYNSGGFSRVPWLELLDLSKWDYRGGVGGNNSSIHNSGEASSSGYPFQEESSSSLSSSSSKRAKFHNREPLTPGVSTMKEPIGSPTSFFASATMLEATPRPPPSHPAPTDRDCVQSFSAMFGDMDESRTVVSFDFSGSTPSSNKNDPRPSSSFHIDITEENLVMLRNLVRRTGLASMTPQHVESLILKHARIERHKYGEAMYVISRSQFGKFIREVVPKESSKHFDSTEIENFSNYFTNFFTCFDFSWSDLKQDEVNAKELMVGFTFLFAGNKSLKLAAAFEMLDVDKVGYLTQRGLMQYLRSYLTMLAGISLLSANKKTTTQIRNNLMSSRRNDAFLAVENGAKWTMSHFMRVFEQEMHSQPKNSTRSNAVTFEDFAKWYTEGGYAVAPWLELLDLQKFLSLIGESSSSKYSPDSNNQSLGDVLFTFPLAKNRSLVVLRDDAHYVRSVVNELGLLSLTSEDIWSILFNDVANSLAKEGHETAATKKSVRMQVDQMTFVHCMMRILSGTGKIKQHSSQWPAFSPEETLKNFYLSFDLDDTKRVPLNQLMCGLTLLCGGKKSNKLVFAFGLCCGDDSSKGGKTKVFMSHEDFFFFFRSFLIVMFSCCNQSLSLSADAVTQYISDTAKLVADDVTAYWKAKQVGKIKFENFSEWYNEGGFETAPWLELLDLNKWVLADQAVPVHQQEPQPHQHKQPQELQADAPPTLLDSNSPPEATHTIKGNGLSPYNPHCPPAPDDDHLFDLDLVDAEEDAMVSLFIDCVCAICKLLLGFLFASTFGINQDLFLQQETAAAQGHA